MGRGPDHQISTRSAAVRPTKFSKLSARPGPARHLFNFFGPARPGPSHFQKSRSGPAYDNFQIGLAHDNFQIGPARPALQAHDMP